MDVPPMNFEDTPYVYWLDDGQLCRSELDDLDHPLGRAVMVEIPFEESVLRRTGVFHKPAEFTPAGSPFPTADEALAALHALATLNDDGVRVALSLLDGNGTTVAEAVKAADALGYGIAK